jgi:paraquat-inducible protein B
MKPPSARLVGLFVIGAVVLAVAAVLTFASGSLFASRYSFVVYFQQSVAGLDVGAPVKFMGVRVGTVRSVSLSLTDRERSLDEVRIPVIFEVDQNLLLQRGLARLSLADTTRLRELIEEGMRVELGVESFVTGKKYISLVVRPDVVPDLVNDPTVPFVELPAIRATGLEDLESNVRQALGRLVVLEVDSVLNQVSRTLETLDRVAGQDLTRTLDQLPGTLARADSTLDALRVMALRMDTGMEPLQNTLTEALQGANGASLELRNTLQALQDVTGAESPLVARLEETLNRLGAAGYAVEALAEYLSRNPDAILRGRPRPEGR